MSIKSFLYLDQHKMFSISSQIFEGLTDRLVKQSENEEVRNDEQKGSIGSGRIMADIASSKSMLTEHRFLHDFAYSLFETEISTKNKLTCIDLVSKISWRDSLPSSGFVKITGTALFNDTKRVKKIISQFNEAGKELAYVTNHEILNTAKKLKKNLNGIKSQAERKKINDLIKAVSLEEIASEAGLVQDEEFLSHLHYMIDFAFSDAFEARVNVPFDREGNDVGVTFSSLLKREYLRESENEIMWKYSRSSQKKFTVFGIITQVGSKKTENQDDAPEGVEEKTNGTSIDITNITPNTDASSMKQGVLALTDFVKNLEEAMIKPSEYEVIIDPIAIYSEV